MLTRSLSKKRKAAGLDEEPLVVMEAGEDPFHFFRYLDNVRDNSNLYGVYLELHFKFNVPFSRQVATLPRESTCGALITLSKRLGFRSSHEVVRILHERKSVFRDGCIYTHAIRHPVPAHQRWRYLAFEQLSASALFPYVCMVSERVYQDGTVHRVRMSHVWVEPNLLDYCGATSLELRNGAMPWQISARVRHANGMVQTVATRSAYYDLKTLSVVGYMKEAALLWRHPDTHEGVCVEHVLVIYPLDMYTVIEAETKHRYEARVRSALSPFLYPDVLRVLMPYLPCE